LGWNPPYDPAPPESLLLPAWPSQSAQYLALAHPTPSLIPPSQCQHDPMSTPHHVVPTCYLWSNSATRASSTQHKITPLTHFPHHLLVINESNGRINPRNGNYESSHSFLNPDLIWSRDQLCSFPDSLTFKRSPCSHCFTLFLPRIHKAPPIAALPQRHLRLIELPSRSRMTRYPRMTMNRSWRTSVPTSRHHQTHMKPLSMHTLLHWPQPLSGALAENRMLRRSCRWRKNRVWSPVVHASSNNESRSFITEPSV
jgi:hypothetical protein